jgi:hypothetical protein
VKQREQLRPVLEAEIKRWSAMSCAQLTSQLADCPKSYEVEFESKKYQVELQILENTDSYVHVGVAVDDGHFWRAMRPLSSSFIRRKDGGPHSNLRWSVLSLNHSWRKIAIALIDQG